MSDGYDVSSLDALTKAMLDTASNRYPKEVKKFLSKEGNEGRKILRSEIKSSTTKRTGNLLKGIKRGKVWKNKEGDWQVRVYDKAPHITPLTVGHTKVLWGKRTGGRVSGKDFFGKANKTFKAKVMADAPRFVDDLLDRGFNI